MSESTWNRRRLITAAARLGTCAGALLVVDGVAARVGASPLPGSSDPESAPDDGGAMGGIGRPPFRVGFQKIFDASIGEKHPWYINDHTFIQAGDGRWHVFGITHREPLDPDHETFLLQATAPAVTGPWRKLAPVVNADTAAGETVVWAPHVIAHDGRYWMFYCAGGTNHEQFRIHLATSPDLATWSRHPDNPMVVDGYDARDPMVLRVADEWVLYYCATEPAQGGNHIVAAVTSRDLVHWSKRQIVFRSPEKGTFGGPTESPFVVARKGKYYLFVCTNEPYNNTAVYVSDTAFSWDSQNIVMTFAAHAAEVIHASEHQWFVSSAGWGQGGLYLADLHWDDEGHG
jgi:arabinan endo-1,5-alpha-L-arabinosidase